MAWHKYLLQSAISLLAIAATNICLADLIVECPTVSNSTVVPQSDTANTYEWVINIGPSGGYLANSSQDPSYKAVAMFGWPGANFKEDPVNILSCEGRGYVVKLLNPPKRRCVQINPEPTYSYERACTRVRNRPQCSDVKTPHYAVPFFQCGD